MSAKGLNESAEATGTSPLPARGCARSRGEKRSACRGPTTEAAPELEIDVGAGVQGLLYRLFEGGFKVSSGTGQWHRSS